MITRINQGDIMKRKKAKKHNKYKETSPMLFHIMSALVLCFYIASFAAALIFMYWENSDYIYADYIKSKALRQGIPMLIFGVICYTVVRIFCRKNELNSYTKGSILAFCVAFMLPVFFTFGIITISYMDIKNEDHIMYTGQFEQDYSYDFVFLNDEKSTRLYNVSNETFLTKGKYCGTVIYSRRSKHLLAYTLDTGETASVAIQSD